MTGLHRSAWTWRIAVALLPAMLGCTGLSVEFAKFLPSRNQGARWTFTLSPRLVLTVAVTGGDGNIYAISDEGPGHRRGEGVYRLTESGAILEVTSEYSLAALAVTPSGHLYAVGEGGVILHRPGPGRPWTKGFPVAGKAPPYGHEEGMSLPKLFLEAVSTCSETEVYAVGRVRAKPSVREWFNVIYHTTDAGRTWQESRHELPLLNAVWCAVPNHVYAVGGEGSVIHSGDGGKTWTRLLTGHPRQRLFAIWGTGLRNIFAVGDGGFLHSTNGGETWALLTPEMSINAFLGLSADHLLVATDHAILESVNRGRSWHPIPDIRLDPGDIPQQMATDGRRHIYVSVGQPAGPSSGGFLLK